MTRLSPIGWALRPLKNYATFTGRASRAEFWWFFLLALVTYGVMMVVVIGSFAGMTPAQASDPTYAMNLFNSGAGILMMLFGLIWIALIVPTIAVQVRRVHDIDRSGWWIGAFWLLYLLYIIVMFATGFSGRSNPGGGASLAGAGAIALLALMMMIYSLVLLVLFCLRGTRGPNRFGDDPYAPPVEEVFA